MNTDTLQDIMLHLPYNDVLAMCSSYHFGNQACTEGFWKRKMMNDFNMNVPGNAKENYKRLHDIHILVKQFFMFLDKQLIETGDFLDNHQFVSLLLPNHGYFFADVYDIDFIITLENNNYTCELIYNYKNNEPITKHCTIQELKDLMVDLMYKHPDLMVQNGLNEHPIMYDDLLVWDTRNHIDKKNKLLKIWQDVKSMNL